MIRKSFFKKLMVGTLVLTFIVNIFVPNYLWALTSGPTAPEATSFEPVDTTDMVNIATGDFVYNLPLLEVPGPAGGYPLSLSYHAGIQPNEDASWVGLGWTLNPGSIARTVNGYPDDQVGARRHRHDYNSGGERRTYSLGVGVGGASMDLSVSHDSNLGVGFGLGFSLGYSVGLGGANSGVGIGAGVSAGMDSYGGEYAGASIGLSIGKGGADAEGLTANLGLSTNFSSVSLGGGVGYEGNGKKNPKTGQSSHFNASIIGGSISSTGLKPSMSVGGFSINQINGNAGRITTEGWGFTTPPIPIGPFTITLGYRYMRYYSSESSNVNVIGALHAKSTANKNPDSWAFDSYALTELDAQGGLLKENDPEKSKGGSFPSYDNYSVMAQGLGGSIQPYILENGTLFRQNLKVSGSSSYEIRYDRVNNSFNFTKPVQFRFKNDFSNAFTYNVDPKMRVSTTYGQSIVFENMQNTITPVAGYNSNTTHLAGSKHVEYFTNKQIKEGVAKSKGFIDYKPNSERETTKFDHDVEEQVGGFMITNESGVTYHFALPVYSYGQFSKSFEAGKENDSYQRNTENQPYAYTWFLTALTGPDYVNRNSANDGTISSTDWGYWIKFDYQQHVDDYVWRNPIVGTHKDVDKKFEFYSYGSKELYYINTISSASHVAVFQKSLRQDGRGVTIGTTGSFNTLSTSNCHIDPECNPNDCTDTDPRVCDGYCNICEYGQYVSRRPLKLDAILLLSSTDYESGTDFSEKVIRKIELTTDYSLVQGTTNSFVDGQIASKGGKLTLTAIKFKGKAEADLMPPLTFSYGKNPTFNADATDVWGLYKSDYDPNDFESIAHMVTIESAKNVDAWSLTKIRSSLGSDILVEYESDSYKKPVLHKGINFHASGFTFSASVPDRIQIEIANETEDVSKHYKVGDNVDIRSLHRYTYTETLIGHNIAFCGPPSLIMNTQSYINKITMAPILATGVNSNGKFYIEVEDSSWYNLYNSLTNYTNLPSHSSTVFVCPISGTVSQNGACPNNEAPQPFICNFNIQKVSGPYVLCAANILNLGRSAEPEFLGGGLRVRELEVKTFDQSRVTKFSYTNPINNNGTTGVTSYEPDGLNIAKYIITGITEDAKNSFESYINDRAVPTLRIAREVPGPGVIYQFVTVKEEIRRHGVEEASEIPGKKVYEFQTFDEDFVERVGLTSTVNGGLYAAECYGPNGVQTYCGPQPPGHQGPPPAFCKDQNGNTINCDAWGGTVYSPMTIKDFSAWVGSLRSMTTYGPNNLLLQKVVNHYFHDGKTNAEFDQQLKTKYGSQGLITQVFHENRFPIGQVFSRKDEYPLIAIGQTSFDYKSGLTTTTQNLAFDFYTGNPLKILYTDGYGNKYATETLPAYKVEAYSGMTPTQITNEFVGLGLKVNNPKNKHMLTQVASTATFKVNDNFETTLNDADKVAFVSASAQTWSDQTLVRGIGSTGDDQNQPGVWRQKSSFNFIGDDGVALRSDGLYPKENFTAFSNWTNGITSGWKQLSEVTLVDTYSHALEASDMNGNFAATKMSLDQTRVFATVANARYQEFAFSGLEETPGVNGMLGGGVVLGGTPIPAAHTGRTAAEVISGGRGFTYSFTNSTAKKFHVSVWSDKPNSFIKYKIGTGADQSAVPTVNQAGAWYLHEAYIDVEADAIVEVWSEANGATTLFDDFRIHPLKSAMVSYVYNQWGELSHILDANNLFTEYRYDGMGRLTGTYRESFQTEYGNNGIVKVGEYKIDYAANNAHLLQLNVSQSGPSGGVSPSGQVNVARGGNQLIYLYEECENNPVLQDIIIDGRSYGTAARVMTIPSGTVLRILKTITSGAINTSVSLENVQALHKVTAKFGAPQLGAPGGNYECEMLSGCFTGRILFFPVDECGRILPSQVAPPGSGGLTCTNPPGSNCLEY